MARRMLVLFALSVFFVSVGEQPDSRFLRRACTLIFLHCVRILHCPLFPISPRRPAEAGSLSLIGDLYLFSEQQAG